MKPATITTIGLLLACPLPVWASDAPPKLVVAIAVDQFSADLYAEYRSQFTDGLARLSEGVVFPSGYQSHAATETCPGHSTILTGARPSRTGIIANNWYDLGVTREDKQVYCSEDPTAPGSSSSNYVVTTSPLKVPTLGDRLKAAQPGAVVVSVAGKDRAAVMMGGRETDQMWYWSGRGYVTLKDRADRTAPRTLEPVNARAAAMLGGVDWPKAPRKCASRSQPVQTGARTVGDIDRHDDKDREAYRAHPAYDALTADLAIGLIREMKLGRGVATDLLAIGLSATDYIGHRYGTEGAEMCANILALDHTIGRILKALDETRTPYVVVLTADHGGHDLPERHDIRAVPDAQRLDRSLTLSALEAEIGARFGLSGRWLYGEGPSGDLYVSSVAVPATVRPQVLGALATRLLANPQVEAVFTAEQLKQASPPKGPPADWSLIDRFRAGFDPDRSGDLLVALKPNVTPIAAAGGSTVATHGSPWNYDRRVPILFYRPGTAGFEQPLSVETVDIAPTLAALIGLDIPFQEIDGRCLDLDAGSASTCPTH